MSRVAGCGDGVVGVGEQCGEIGLVCPVEQTCDEAACVCSGGPLCGDGTINPGEQCNEPAIVCPSTKLCDVRTCTCVIVPPAPRCGDGKLDHTEECDDGNARDGDGCDVLCRLEQGRCGDGVLQSALGEQCEPSTHDQNLIYECTPACRFLSHFCSDGYFQPGEECDDGPNNSNVQNARCRLDCSLGKCGDSILDSAFEQCDDGNTVNGDGCDRTCRREFPGQFYVFGGSIVELHAARDETSVRPVDRRPPSTSETGPGLIAVMAAGASAGYAWMRRRRS
ncbi:MAG: hypothetical protein G01um101425_953 [Candidatus Peregrinibacteria bacterium Gr01-1014_25]|nr:MAG: hypothetical protein G01um101425_953 [Candidatus Peregrinibacteria bacterium Gr01-1014_25]